MTVDNKLLFGIDDSEFAQQALAKAGDLQKNNEDLRITLYGRTKCHE